MVKLTYFSLKKVLIIFSLTMMIFSALLSYFVVKTNEPKIHALKSEIQKNENLIRDIWGNLNRKENKIDMIILLSAINNKKSLEFMKYYLKNFSELTVKSNIKKVIEYAKTESENDIEYINNLYLSQVKNKNTLENLEEKNKNFSDIAFFLQFLGVILILLIKDYFK